MTDDFRRMPPHSFEAEESVIGGLLLDPTRLAEVADVCAPEAFYREEHRRIFAAMLDLHARHQPVDTLTLRDLLRAAGSAVPIATLLELSERVPTAVNVAHYAAIVARCATQRELVEVGRWLADRAGEHRADVPALLLEAEARLRRANTSQRERLAASASEAVQAALERLDQPQAARVPFGLASLDDELGGMLRGTVVVLGGRPGTGKSALADHFVRQGAIPAGIAGITRSVEMTGAELMLRAAAGLTGIENRHLQRGIVPMHRRDDLVAAMAQLRTLPWFIRDQAAPWPQDLLACEALIAAHPAIGVLVIDHVQIVRGVPGEGREPRHVVISEISASCVAFAKRHHVCVVLLSQLNRESEKQNREPLLSDLRESGSLEQDASVVLFLHDPVPEDRSVDKQLSLIVAKNRQGPIGRFAIRFDKAGQTMRDASEYTWGGQAEA